MEIIVAEPCGFCYGVRRAVDLAESAVDSLPAATLGQLVHNAQVTDALAAKGIACKDSLDQFSAGETVIFRSHGVGPEVYEKAIEKKLKILDATCPNVKVCQSKARQAFEDGYLPIIVGEKNHPEVKSILAFAGKNAIIIERKEDIGEVPLVSKYCVIIQTTFELAKFEEILQALQTARPGEYRVERTICLATKERQNAAAKLAAETDAFIIIGGRNSACQFFRVGIHCPVVPGDEPFTSIAKRNINAFFIYLNYFAGNEFARMHAIVFHTGIKHRLEFVTLYFVDFHVFHRFDSLLNYTFRSGCSGRDTYFSAP